MKITRYKKVQKYLKFYYNNYGFRQPYQVLIDGTFCFAAFKPLLLVQMITHLERLAGIHKHLSDCFNTITEEQINIREQLPKYLSGHAKLLTTRCIIIETEKISKKTHGALTILKQFGIHECDHNVPISGSECILSMIGKNNEKHYILATQDRDLQEKLRQVAGVPLLYLHNKSPTLEKPSKVTYEKVNGQNDPTHLFITETQNVMLRKMKQAFGVEKTSATVKIHMKDKKNKPHNPNPLSCKKKKKKPAQNEKKNINVSSEGKVKKRNRKKPSKKIKDKIKAVMNN